jgi:CxxC-x17-CxxC domain-containing protein
VQPLWPPFLRSASRVQAISISLVVRGLLVQPSTVIAHKPGVHDFALGVLCLLEGEIKMSENRTTGASTESASDFQDRPISCVDCGDQFVWSVGEQVFFHDKGLRNEPKRCKPCKQAKTLRLAAISAAQTSGIRQRIEVTVTCAQCGQQTTVPFYPSQGRPVYCRSCFMAARAMSASA